MGRGGSVGRFSLESELLDDLDVLEKETDDFSDDFLLGTFGLGLPAGDLALIRDVTGVLRVGVID